MIALSSSDEEEGGVEQTDHPCVRTISELAEEAHIHDLFDPRVLGNCSCACRQQSVYIYSPRVNDVINLHHLL